jgi:hypothetical protein
MVIAFKSAQTTRDAVLIACRRMRLCGPAQQQCVDRAMRSLRIGSSVARAIADGKALARRICGFKESA